MVQYPDVDVAVGAGMKNSFPEIISSTRITGQNQMFMHNGDKLFKEAHITFCDSNFLRGFFDSPVGRGCQNSPEGPEFHGDYTADGEKIFWTESHGKNPTSDGNSFKITGLIDKMPDNDHFHFDAFISMASNPYAINGTTWSNLGFYTYLLLNKGADPKKLEAKFPQLIKKYVAPEAVHDMGISWRKRERNKYLEIFPDAGHGYPSAFQYQI